MGWFWGSSSNKDDPTKTLDPKLREFLEHESPQKYTPTDVPPPPPREETPVTRNPPPPPDASAFEAPKQRPLPKESLFQDGRYAHLWKDYKPLAEVEGADQSPAQRVVEEYKERKYQLHKAALENCAEEHGLLQQCFTIGDWKSRMRARATMCRRENKTFSRCYTMQAKFLQALGYMRTMDRDPLIEERIQMHADKLYHRVIEHEEAVAEAEAAGADPPPISALFPSQNPSGPPDAETGEKQIPEHMRHKLKKSMKELSPHERELEIATMKGAMAQSKVYTEDLKGVFKGENEARMKRREVLTRWFGETIANWMT